MTPYKVHIEYTRQLPGIDAKLAQFCIDTNKTILLEAVLYSGRSGRGRQSGVLSGRGG